MNAENVETGKTKIIYGPCALVFCSTQTGTWRIVRPVIDSDRCIACGICEKHCPTGVMTTEKMESMENRKSKGTVSIDLDYCKGCGICANVCPKEAITMIDEREA